MIVLRTSLATPFMALAALALAGCAVDPEPVIQTRVVETKVPVTVPCMGERPGPITALIDSIPRDEWDALTTDRRANLLAAQALERKLYGEKLADAAAGCR